MKEYVYLDGKKIDDLIPLRTLFYGEGVFETFRFRNRLPVLFDEHLYRMEKGASVLQVPFPSRQHIKEVTEQALSESQLDDAYVKICLFSYGDTTFYKTADSSQVLVIIKEYSSEDSPIRLMVNSFKINSDTPLRAVKSMNYLDHILARREAVGANVDDVIFLNERDEVVECSAGNIFWHKDNTLHTPSHECGCLPGTTRDLVLELASSCNIKSQSGKYSLDSLIDSDFIFITNSLTGCIPVAELQGKRLLVDHDKFKVIKKALYDKLEWT